MLFSLWSLRYLFINFNSFLVLLQLSAVVSDLQETFVGRAERHAEGDTVSRSFKCTLLLSPLPERRNEARPSRCEANLDNGCCICAIAQNTRPSALHCIDQQTLWSGIFCFPLDLKSWYKEKKTYLVKKNKKKNYCINKVVMLTDKFIDMSDVLSVTHLFDSSPL